ncbi:uncharacterized protein LOC143644036 isoform X2 [Tamandua tetradactyla]|uniref:uncharacterized protein LOC143644036 isoform X2 n=1 Tax=Tamandua tetradactyla TaxID=48850 RepID=UPI004053FB4E
MCSFLGVDRWCTLGTAMWIKERPREICIEEDQERVRLMRESLRRHHGRPGADSERKIPVDSVGQENLRTALDNFPQMWPRVPAASGISSCSTAAQLFTLLSPLLLIPVCCLLFVEMKLLRRRPLGDGTEWGIPRIHLCPQTALSQVVTYLSNQDVL